MNCPFNMLLIRIVLFLYNTQLVWNGGRAERFSWTHIVWLQHLATAENQAMLNSQTSNPWSELNIVSGRPPLFAKCTSRIIDLPNEYVCSFILSPFGVLLSRTKDKNRLHSAAAVVRQSNLP